jgi:hypothetical protein
LSFSERERFAERVGVPPEEEEEVPNEEEEAPSDMMAVTTWLIETGYVDRERGQRWTGDDDQRETDR